MIIKSSDGDDYAGRGSNAGSSVTVTVTVPVPSLWQPQSFLASVGRWIFCICTSGIGLYTYLPYTISSSICVESVASKGEMRRKTTEEAIAIPDSPTFKCKTNSRKIEQQLRQIVRKKIEKIRNLGVIVEIQISNCGGNIRSKQMQP